tara:strand:+ start:36 stop:317 length:282 start_codon:yes stop_codon:yes gene_type:complete
MEDLIRLVKHYINGTYLPKHIDCSYPYHYSLDGVADIINNLSDYKVKIKTETPGHSRYVGEYTPLIQEITDNYVGLEYGIKETYNKIYWNEKN